MHPHTVRTMQPPWKKLLRDTGSGRFHWTDVEWDEGWVLGPEGLVSEFWGLPPSKPYHLEWILWTLRVSTANNIHLTWLLDDQMACMQVNRLGKGWEQGKHAANEWLPLKDSIKEVLAWSVQCCIDVCTEKQVHDFLWTVKSEFYILYLKDYVL